jgi:hypothetical protein
MKQGDRLMTKPPLPTLSKTRPLRLYRVQGRLRLRLGGGLPPKKALSTASKICICNLCWFNVKLIQENLSRIRALFSEYFHFQKSSGAGAGQIRLCH